MYIFSHRLSSTSLVRDNPSYPSCCCFTFPLIATPANVLQVFTYFYKPLSFSAGTGLPESQSATRLPLSEGRDRGGSPRPMESQLDPEIGEMHMGFVEQFRSGESSKARTLPRIHDTIPRENEEPLGGDTNVMRPRASPPLIDVDQETMAPPAITLHPPFHRSTKSIDPLHRCWLLLQTRKTFSVHMTTQLHDIA
jgi:hypothetical protein